MRCWPRRRPPQARPARPLTPAERGCHRYHVTFAPFTAANGERHRDLTLTVYGTSVPAAILHAEVLLELDYTPRVDPGVTRVVETDSPDPARLTLRA